MSESKKCMSGCTLAFLANEWSLLAVAAIAFQSVPSKQGAERLFRIAQRCYEYDLLGDAGLEAIMSHTAHFGVPDENGEVPAEVTQ